MTTPQFEAFLARLYTDAAFRERVLANPRREALLGGLDETQAEAIVSIDRVALGFATRSFDRKRAHKRNHSR